MSSMSVNLAQSQEYVTLLIDDVDLANLNAHCRDKTGAPVLATFRVSSGAMFQVPVQGEYWSAKKQGWVWNLESRQESEEDHDWNKSNLAEGDTKIKGTNVHLLVSDLQVNQNSFGAPFMEVFTNAVETAEVILTHTPVLASIQVFYETLFVAPPKWSVAGNTITFDPSLGAGDVTVYYQSAATDGQQIVNPSLPTGPTDSIDNAISGLQIVNANVDPAAAIAYSKLALTNSILNADVNSAAGIAYSKLALTNSVVNADVNSSAAIAYSKLALNNSIVNSDINASAAITASKLSGYPADATKYLRGDGTWSAMGATAASSSSAVVNTANTDLSLPDARAAVNYINIITGGGSIRTIQAPTNGAGYLVIRSSAGNTNSVTLLHNTSGSYVPMWLEQSNAVFYDGWSAHFQYSSYNGLWLCSGITPGNTQDGYGTSLPASPFDGMVSTLVDSTTNPSYQWRFRYNARSSSSYKWEFIGGAPAYLDHGAITVSAGATTNANVTFTLPRSGDYIHSAHCWGMNITTNNYAVLYSYDGASTAQLGVAGGNNGGDQNNANITGWYKWVNKTSGTVIYSRFYDTGGSSMVFVARSTITPVRVS